MTSEKPAFATLEGLYSYYNANVFANILPQCSIAFSSGVQTEGFYRRSELFKENVHEILLNPDLLFRPEKEWHPVVVHQMVHLWQTTYGKPPVAHSYHNREWSDKMDQIGLMPSATGGYGGPKVGKQIGQYILKNGCFDIAFNSISAETHTLLKTRYVDKNFMAKNRNEITGKEQTYTQRMAYECSCNNTLWAKANMNVQCMDCGNNFTPKKAIRRYEFKHFKHED